MIVWLFNFKYTNSSVLAINEAQFCLPMMEYTLADAFWYSLCCSVTLR